MQPQSVKTIREEKSQGAIWSKRISYKMLASNCRKSSGVKEIDNDSYQRGNCKCGGSPAWRISPLFPIWGKSVCQTIFLMYLLTVVNQRTRLIHQIPRRNNISPRWRICATFYLLFISCCYYFPLIPFHLPPRYRFPQMGFRYRAVKMAFIYHQLFVRYNAFFPSCGNVLRVLFTRKALS